MEQNRKPEINPHTYGELIYDKKGKNIKWGKDCLFNNRNQEDQQGTLKKMKLEYFLTPYKNKPKMD